MKDTENILLKRSQNSPFILKDPNKPQNMSHKIKAQAIQKGLKHNKNYSVVFNSRNIICEKNNTKMRFISPQVSYATLEDSGSRNLPVLNKKIRTNTFSDIHQKSMKSNFDRSEFTNAFNGIMFQDNSLMKENRK